MPAAAIPLIASGIGAAGAVAGAGIASHAQGKAQKAQLTAANQAQGAVTNAYNTGRQTLGDVYRTQQANLSPYQQLGTQALGSLTSRMGLTQAGTVLIRDPQGIVRHVPQAQVPQALQAGGVTV